MLTRQTRVLQNWSPPLDLHDHSIDNQTALGKLFVLCLRTLRYPVTIQSIHSPSSEWKGNFDWHQDCSGEDGEFIVWSNVGPTEARFLNDGMFLKAHDCDMILIKNLEVEHRTTSPVPDGRWLVRSNYL